MDTAIIATLIGYEVVAAVSHVKIHAKIQRSFKLPLITDILMKTNPATRWSFVGALSAVMADHLSLVDVPLI